MYAVLPAHCELSLSVVLLYDTHSQGHAQMNKVVVRGSVRAEVLTGFVYSLNRMRADMAIRLSTHEALHTSHRQAATVHDPIEHELLIDLRHLVEAVLLPDHSVINQYRIMFC